MTCPRSVGNVLPDFATKPTIDGDLVRLVPLETRHLDELWPAYEDAELARLTGSTGTFTRDETERIIAGRRYAPDRLDLAVIERATGRCVGEVVLNEWDEHNRSCNFRTLFVASGRDRGFGTEAIRLMLEHAFNTLALHRISLGVFAFNARARRVYEKLGFVEEGVLRETLNWDGEWHDEIIMSILEDEWRSGRELPIDA